MMATQEILEKAVARGCNLLITHEPLFYNHHNTLQHIPDDPVYAAKEQYLNDHQLCVFHLHDNLHNPNRDYVAIGMAKKLGWEKYRTDDGYKRFKMPGVKLKDILRDLKAGLEPAALRYIGDEDAVYENVIASWGFMMPENGIRKINGHESCVLITGETHEWEFVEYAHDAAQLGFRKALIVTGHVPSEESGMEFFCGYLREKFPALSIEYIKTNDLYQIERESTH
jgi:putative NIF3 family GTP cyclohydrolase 1 type 2